MKRPPVYELPLFPLNTVLFPGMPLPLHIFEERYKLLVNDCSRDHKPFGVVLIKAGIEVGATAEPHPVGTTTLITGLERLPEGRFNIETVGQDRFRILELRTDKPYLTALVEDFPITNPDTVATRAAADQLRPWVSRYMSLLARAAETPFDAARLPSEPLALAYLAAIVLQTPPASKQILLTLPSATELLQEERKLYRSELALLDTLLTQIPSEWDTSFSPN